MKAGNAAGGKSREGCIPHSPAMQSNIFEETLSIRRGGIIMATTLERISQLSTERPDMVFTSIGHLINKDLLTVISLK
jgi:hypothetical protein